MDYVYAGGGENSDHRKNRNNSHNDGGFHFDSSHLSSFELQGGAPIPKELSSFDQRRCRGRGRGRRGVRDAFNPSAIRTTFGGPESNNALGNNRTKQPRFLTKDGKGPLETKQRFGKEAANSPNPFAQISSRFCDGRSHPQAGDNPFGQSTPQGGGSNPLAERNTTFPPHLFESRSGRHKRLHSDPVHRHRKH